MDRFITPLFVMLAIYTPADADVRQLDVNAEACAIYSALTGVKSPSCPEINVGYTRSLDRGAIPVKDIEHPNGYYIHFAFGSDELTSEYQQHLRRLSEIIESEDLSQLCLKLVGHTDRVGSKPFNQALSEKRARSVRLYLVGAMGVSEKRVVANGRGEEQLISGLDGRDARHRRVEILARDPNEGSCQG